MTTALTVRTIHVEGDTDHKVLSRWFPAADFKAAQGKDQVRSRVENSTVDYGVLDRDFATDEQVQATRMPESRLIILSRYCIENYLLEPDIIAAAFAELNLTDEHPAHIWLDETHIRRTLHDWGATLALYAAANAIVAQWRERINLDPELGFLQYFRLLPPLSRSEILESLHQRLAALPSKDEVEHMLDTNLSQITEDIQTWSGLHRWIDGKVLLKKLLYPQAFAYTGLSQARVRDLLIEAGRTRIPDELQTLSHRW
jgi:hypothetical protein